MTSCSFIFYQLVRNECRVQIKKRLGCIRIYSTISRRNAGHQRRVRILSIRVGEKHLDDLLLPPRFCHMEAMDTELAVP